NASHASCRTILSSSAGRRSQWAIRIVRSGPRASRQAGGQKSQSSVGPAQGIRFDGADANGSYESGLPMAKKVEVGERNGANSRITGHFSGPNRGRGSN